MNHMTIFCPQCEAFIADQPACPKCGWQRPAPADKTLGQQLWRYDAGAKVHGAPVRAGDLLLVGSEDGTLHAVPLPPLPLGEGPGPALSGAEGVGAVPPSRAGEGPGEGWTYRLPLGCPAETVAVWESLVFLTAQHATPEESQPAGQPAFGPKSLVALRLADGAEVWRFPTDALNLSAPAVAGGVVYFSSSGRVLYAVDAASGQVRWQADLPGQWGPGAPALAEGLVVLGARDRVVAAFDAATGQRRWAFQAPGAELNWLPTTPAYAAGVFYAASWDGHLYALDAQTGQPRWTFAVARGQALTSAPALDEERVYVGCRDRHLYAVWRRDGAEAWRFKPAGEHPRPINATPAVADGVVYAAAHDHHLYALDAATGRELWRFAAGRKIRSSPLVADDAVIFGSDDGGLYAVRRRAPVETRTAEELEAAGRWAEALAAYARRGDLAEIARILADQGETHKAAQVLRQAGDLAGAAQLYRQANDLETAQELYRQLDDQLAVAELAVARGRFREGAELFARLGRHREAGDAYRQAGDRRRAAEAFEKAGETALALELYEELGDWRKQAGLLIGLTRHALAARIYEAHGSLAEAAEQYERAGDLDRAAPLYEQAGAWERARRVHHDRGDVDREAAMCLKLGRSQEAAAVYEAAGRFQEAGQLYEQAGVYSKAHPCYAQAGDWERSAALYLKQGQHVKAAELYETAALRLEQEQPAAEERLAGLFERAEQAYLDGYDEERAAACHDKVVRYRRLPRLVVGIKAERGFRVGEYNTLQLVIENQGYGLAREITVRAGRESQTFKGPGMQTMLIRSLRPNAIRGETLSVCPLEAGPQVPLDIEVCYTDPAGRECIVTSQHFVAVARHEEPKGLTPSTLFVMGDMFTGEALKTGDIGYVGGPRSVERIQEALRNFREGTPPPSEAVRECPHCHQPTPASNFCAKCGKSLSTALA